MPEMRPAYVAEREVFTPSALVRQAREVLEARFPLIWVEGEISNFSRPVSGHLYFSLKDAQAQVRCAMFKPKSTWLRFRPADGMRVLARVRVGLYEARGEFQLIVEHMEPAGEGALLRAFAELKARLAAEGLFDAARKRPLPRLPRRIAVITSPTGAAIRDVLAVIARRFALVEIDVLPVPVQGKEAPPAIVAMLAAASATRRHDIVLLARGGGSLEDLWAFNEEIVARAIHASALPVVSAIGHEVDFTIADFVADLRAATPSAAAELLVPDAAELLRLAEQRRDRLALRLRHVLHALAQRADHAYARLRAQHPAARLARSRERLAALARRLEQTGIGALGAARGRLALLGSRLDAGTPSTRIARYADRLGHARARSRTVLAHALHARALRLAELARALNATSPLATLDRGYAILTRAADGHVVRAAAEAPPGTLLRARLAAGEVLVRRENDDAG
ncbi:MAG TPA: exodeoxyribonuclease VII large subunit [Rudaea sp.]|nr:exodeoxyribonuclease VII large subunit [Rudaea sp.]